jgi:hypothetical protein
MASPNAAFSIADGEQLPFNPAPHSTDVTEDFTVEISLLCAQFKTQNSAAAALDSSPTAAVLTAPTPQHHSTRISTTLGGRRSRALHQLPVI